jgi:4-hydroxy-tetrahydrodipicolinate reductase
MTIRILVNGAFGRMGQATVDAINADPELSLVGQAGESDDLTALIQTTQADVVVDFTLASVAYENASRIIAANCRPVIGTTGLTAHQVVELQERCKTQKLGCIIAPNFALSAVLLMKYAKDAAQYFKDVEIIEMHHERKQDAPSGTAIRTAELIATQGIMNPSRNEGEQELFKGARGGQHHGIPIHAVRLPGILAYQEVIFGGIGETLSIRHNTLDRHAYMPGVVLACKKVMALKHLVYGLEHLL